MTIHCYSCTGYGVGFHYESKTDCSATPICTSMLAATVILHWEKERWFNDTCIVECPRDKPYCYYHKNYFRGKLVTVERGCQESPGEMDTRTQDSDLKYPEDKPSSIVHG